MSDRFDWPALMAVGLRGLRLRPVDFWALTPAELVFLAGRNEAQGLMDRPTLDKLLDQFPDERDDDEI